MILLHSFLFALAFLTVSKIFPADASSIDSYSILQVFEQYASYAGIVFALLSLLLMLILSGALSLFGMKDSPRKKALLILLGFAPWAVFGYQLLYREARYANIAKAIIEYLGFPLLVSSLLVMSIALVLFIVQSFRSSSVSS